MIRIMGSVMGRVRIDLCYGPNCPPELREMVPYRPTRPHAPTPTRPHARMPISPEPIATASYSYTPPRPGNMNEISSKAFAMTHPGSLINPNRSQANAPCCKAKICAPTHG